MNILQFFKEEFDINVKEIQLTTDFSNTTSIKQEININREVAEQTNIDYLVIEVIKPTFIDSIDITDMDGKVTHMGIDAFIDTYNKTKSKEPKKKHLYHAGRIFSEATFRQREFENKCLEIVLNDEVTKFSPLFDNPANEKDNPDELPTAQDIFQGDTDEVIKSDMIYAELDGEDPGVIAELGIAWGINYMLDRLTNIVMDNHSEEAITKEVFKLLEVVPHKKVYATISDIRTELAGMYTKETVPVGFNQYVIGMVNQMGDIAYSFKDTLSQISQDIGKKDVKISEVTDIVIYNDKE